MKDKTDKNEKNMLRAARLSIVKAHIPLKNQTLADMMQIEDVKYISRLLSGKCTITDKRLELLCSALSLNGYDIRMEFLQGIDSYMTKSEYEEYTESIDISGFVPDELIDFKAEISYLYQKGYEIKRAKSGNQYHLSSKNDLDYKRILSAVQFKQFLSAFSKRLKFELDLI